MTDEELATEREHCIQIVNGWQRNYDGLVDTLMRERAAVRAEYEAKIAELEAKELKLAARNAVLERICSDAGICVRWDE